MATSIPSMIGVPPPRRSNVVIDDKFSIPPWVDDLPSFRRWATSEAFPSQGQFSFLDATIWVGLGMEELWTHNQVKAAYTFTLMGLLHGKNLGRFVPDRMLLTNVAANLSTEPDGLYFHYTTLQSGQLRLVDKPEAGILELDGTPDMVLEVVSKNSVRKDSEVLRDLYWKANIQEYWLVDARLEFPVFTIFRHEPSGYVPNLESNLGIPSQVFPGHFRLRKDLDPLGHPMFTVDFQPPSGN